MFALKEVKPLEYTVLKVDIENPEFTVGGFFSPVTDLEDQAFCLNFAGYPRNDINRILETEDVRVAEYLAQNLMERQSDGKSEQDCSDADLIIGMKSKYDQTASEVVSHLERVLEERDRRLIEKGEQVELEKSLKEKEALRKSIYDTLTNEERDRYLSMKRTKEIEKLIEVV